MVRGNRALVVQQDPLYRASPGRCPDTPRTNRSSNELVQEMICRNKVILLAMIAGLTDYIGSVFLLLQHKHSRYYQKC